MHGYEAGIMDGSSKSLPDDVVSEPDCGPGRHEFLIESKVIWVLEVVLIVF